MKKDTTIQQVYRDDTIGRKYRRTIRTPMPARTKDDVEAALKKYNIGVRLYREDFLALPDDLKGKYIQRLRDCYHAPDGRIAESLDMIPSAFSNWVRKSGAKTRVRYTKKDIDEVAWSQFLESREKPVKKKPIMLTNKSVSMEFVGKVDVKFIKREILKYFDQDDELCIQVVVTKKEESQ